MPAETLNCPMCGAAASTEATRCEHCGARLATVACPKCFGMMFVGEKFCSHCGARADRTEVADAKPEICPRCRVVMNAVVIGGSPLRECPRCEGIWADADALHQICEDQEKQSAVMGMAGPVVKPESQDVEDISTIHYIPCPVCGDLMNRVNFAHCSHVIVNVCGRHGTWFTATNCGALWSSSSQADWWKSARRRLPIWSGKNGSWRDTRWRRAAWDQPIHREIIMVSGESGLRRRRFFCGFC